MKAGEYAFTPGTTPRAVMRKLAAGEIHYRRLTVPEGLTTHQITKLLEAAEGLSGALESIAEGALLPDTYFYTRGETRAALAARMAEAREQALAALWGERAHEALSREQAVILASIVEKETGKPEERGRIASVFLNRLRRGIALQSDPTVIYAVTEGRATLERALTRKDLRIASPYNTYLHPGLPPGPICNPGVESLKAVLQPPGTNDLYFVADGAGGHFFARTLKEHNRNVAKYRKRVGEWKK